VFAGEARSGSTAATSAGLIDRHPVEIGLAAGVGAGVDKEAENVRARGERAEVAGNGAEGLEGSGVGDGNGAADVYPVNFIVEAAAGLGGGEASVDRVVSGGGDIEGVF